MTTRQLVIALVVLLVVAVVVGVTWYAFFHEPRPEPVLVS